MVRSSTGLVVTNILIGKVGSVTHRVIELYFAQATQELTT